MKRIIFILHIVLLFIGCKGLFDRKDDELSFVKTPNTSDKIRLDGYYYKYIVPDKVGIRIYYQNGIVYSTSKFNDIKSFEKKANDGRNEITRESIKIQWGLYLIKEDSIFTNGLGIVSGDLHFSETFSKGIILNDTTILFKETKFSNGYIDSYNDTLHFKQFSPKPDSTNVFIK